MINHLVKAVYIILPCLFQICTSFQQIEFITSRINYSTFKCKAIFVNCVYVRIKDWGVKNGVQV